MELPRRLSILGCIGCGAMRQQESCEGARRERRLELVSGGDYDELTAVAAACRDRIKGFRAVVGELARTEPGPGELRVAYEALQQSARSVLRRSGPAAGDRGDELPARAETVIVWRCEAFQSQARLAFRPGESRRVAAGRAIWEAQAGR